MRWSVARFSQASADKQQPKTRVFDRGIKEMKTKLSGFVSALALTIASIAGTSGANAADFGGDCCADLEERIAELEATTVRKGNRKVSLTVTGHIHQAILFWDDGEESNAYVVDNQNDQSFFAFAGDARINSDWSAGFNIVVRLQDALSGEVSADDDDTDLDPFILREANWFIESKTYGRVTTGFAPRVSDTAPERDLSGTNLAAYSGVQDIGGGFALRRSGDGTALGVSFGDLISHLNGDTGNIVRYDTPEFGGFVLSASFGEDDIWDVGIAYAGQIGGISIDAAIAYTEVTDENGIFGDDGGPDNEVIVGSIAFLHEPSGLNFLVAAGQQSFSEAVADADGVNRVADDYTFVYFKAGVITKLNSLGTTSFYGEYGHFEDLLTAGAEAGLVANLTGGAGARLTGSEVDAYGGGVVQNIEAADMDLYVGYRFYEAGFDAVDGAGASVATAETEDFQSVIMGADIRF